MLLYNVLVQMYLTANTAHVQEATLHILSHIMLIRKETGLPSLLNTDPHFTPDLVPIRQRTRRDYAVVDVSVHTECGASQVLF